MRRKIKEAAFALSLLGTVSALCLRGMKAVGDKIQERIASEHANAYRKEQ